MQVVSNMEEVRLWKERARLAVLREVERRGYKDIDTYILSELAILIGLYSYDLLYVKHFINPDSITFTHGEAARFDKIFNAWDRGEEIERCRFEDIEDRYPRGFVLKNLRIETEKLLERAKSL